GFEGDVEGGAGQAVVRIAGRGLAQGDHFRVGAGVVAADGLIEAAADDLAITDQDRAHRHLAQLGTLARFGDGLAHEIDISWFHLESVAARLSHSMDGKGYTIRREKVAGIAARRRDTAQISERSRSSSITLSTLAVRSSSAVLITRSASSGVS